MNEERLGLVDALLHVMVLTGLTVAFDLVGFGRAEALAWGLAGMALVSLGYLYVLVAHRVLWLPRGRVPVGSSGSRRT